MPVTEALAGSYVLGMQRTERTVGQVLGNQPLELPPLVCLVERRDRGSHIGRAVAVVHTEPRVLRPGRGCRLGRPDCEVTIRACAEAWGAYEAGLVNDGAGGKGGWRWTALGAFVVLVVSKVDVGLHAH